MLLIIAGGVYGDSQNFSQPVTLPETPVSIEGKQGKCGDGICDAKEKQNPRVCPQDCKPADNDDATETCGQDNNGYCIDFREECKTGYEDIGPDTCRRGRSAGCCVPESLAKKTCAEQNGNFCSTSQTCSGSWLDASDSDTCCDGECESSAVDYNDSPFGISIAGFLAKDYSQSLEYMAEAGAGTVRFMANPSWGGLSWKDVEYEKGKFDWSEPDEHYLKAKENELNIMVNIYPDTPKWDPNYDENVIMQYPTWILGTEMWRGEGWSETHGGKKWWRGTPEEYADLFVETYKAIKIANSDAVVKMAGSNPLIDEEEETDYEERVFKKLRNLIQDIPNFSFVYSLHFYPGDKRNFEAYAHAIDLARQVLGENGFYNVPITITDAACFLLKEDSSREEKVAEYIIKTYVFGLAHDVKNIVWAQLSDGLEYGKRFEAGLISNPSMSNQDENHYKNLGFYTYKLMVEKLEGSDWDNIQTIQESDNIYIYKFMKNGKPVWVAWWDYFDDSGTEKSITIDVGNINSVKITKAVPKYETGQEVTDYSTAFNTETKTASGGKVTITLGESPVFIEEISNTSIEETGSITPKGFQLNQNYPNPFNPTTTICYQLPVCSKVNLKIYDILGNEVRTLVNENKAAGYHSVVWNGADNSGRQLSSGVYFYSLKLDINYSITKKLLLLK
jgi:flavodoxin